MEVISDDSFRRLDKFRSLRNRAAHEPFFEVPFSEMQQFVDGLPDDGWEPPAWVLPEVGPPTLGDVFFETCSRMVDLIFESHCHELLSLFAPAACSNAQKYIQDQIDAHAAHSARGDDYAGTAGDDSGPE